MIVRAVPLWVVVVGLVASFQPQATIGANVLLLVVGGVVAPAICLVVMHRWQRALAASRPKTRRT